MPARQTGFTLIELMIVLALLGLLAGLVTPRLADKARRAKPRVAQAQLHLLDLALEDYAVDLGAFPSSAQGLAALTAAPADLPDPALWQGPYLKAAPPADPWGHAYAYQGPDQTGGGYRLACLGSDGRPGGSGPAADLTRQAAFPDGSALP